MKLLNRDRDIFERRLWKLDAELGKLQFLHLSEGQKQERERELCAEVSTIFAMLEAACEEDRPWKKSHESDSPLS